MKKQKHLIWSSEFWVIVVNSNGPNQSGPKAIKLQLNSAEHEICPANKSQITNTVFDLITALCP